MKTLSVLAVALFSILFVVFFAGFIVWITWNAVIPSTFGLPNLTFFQSICMTLLVGALFGRNSDYKSKED